MTKWICGFTLAFLIVGVLAATLRTAKATPYDNWFRVDPLYYKATHVGETFDINVKLNITVGQGGHGLYGYAFKFYWCRNLINATGFTAPRPPEWSDNWADVGSGLDWDYNATHGRYYTATTAFSPAPEVYGIFTLVIIHFNAIHQPYFPEPNMSCVLNIEDAAYSCCGDCYPPHVDVYDGLYEIGNMLIPGDIDYNRVVNLFDLVIVGTAWNSEPGDPHWDERADLNKDDIVYLSDLTIVGSHFGETV
jgi:hypothetical protein